MATVISYLKVGYKFLNEDSADPRTKDFFLISSAWPILGLLFGYLYFIFIWGPKFMKNRLPFNLDRIMQLYNLLQVLLCGTTFIMAMKMAWFRDYNYICQPIDFSYEPRPLKITRLVWFYFLIKIMDLLDTIFFVLRKKQNQVTFLHVYHHTGMVFGSWCATKYLPGGHITSLGTINTLVHVFMYSYYLLTSLKVDTSAWKKHITQIQLIQFFLITVHFSLLILTDCDFPKWPAAVMVPQNVFMMIMFGDFYYKEYIKKKPAKKATSTKLEANGFIAEIVNGKSKGQ